MKLKIVKKADAKKKDARPSIRLKIAGNTFLEVYKDGKGYFYRIDIPGVTDFVSKERFPNQDKARRAGETHAKKFVSKIRGDAKKKDADVDYVAFEKMLDVAEAKYIAAGNNLKHQVDTSYDLIEKFGRRFEDAERDIDDETPVDYLFDRPNVKKLHKDLSVSLKKLEKLVQKIGSAY